MQQVAFELGISERQAYRDLKRSEEYLALLLWQRLGGEFPAGQAESSKRSGGATEQSMQDEDEVEEEVVALQFRPVNLQELLRNAGHAVKRLAGQVGVDIDLQLPPEPILISTDQRLAQQILTNLFSQVLQISRIDRLVVQLRKNDEQAEILFEYDSPESQVPILENQMVLHFMHQLGWQFEIDGGSQSDRPFSKVLKLVAAGQEITILVIDDHPPLIELLRRYLTNSRCRVVGVSNGQEGLALARALHPNAVLLDVMMPEIDGWEILQRLRNTPETAHIPVVICSIFNDPKLAYSLGASAILAKPVKREQLLDVLRSLSLLS